MRTTPPGKIKDFAHLPLHRGGFLLRRDWAFGTTSRWWFSLSKKNRNRDRLRFFAP